MSGGMLPQENFFQIRHSEIASEAILGALSPTSKLSRKLSFVSFGGDVKPSVPGNPLKLA